MFSIFTLPYTGYCIASFVFVALSIVLFRYRKDGMGIVSLFLAALFIRLFMAWQDAFLHPWDEQFHALVARNMMGHPLKPMLRENPMGWYDPFSWANCHIWLHKQPLFLWLGAASLKIFGVSEFALRYPSVLLGALMVPILYSIGYMLTGQRRVAWLAAVIFCYSGFQLELISGEQGMDHNDVAFGFFVLAGVWACIRYFDKQTLWRAALVGVFAGAAVLNKWLTGLVVFSGWGLVLLMSPKQFSRKDWGHLLLAMLVCVIVFLPWQLYIFHEFPVEAKFEYDYNARHITVVVEGHKGGNFFYIDQFETYFGEVGWFFVPLGLVVLMLRYRHNGIANKRATVVLVTVFSAVFIFFSYMVATKLSNYLFAVVPIGVVFMALGIVALGEKIGQSSAGPIGQAIIVVLSVAVVISIFNPELIHKMHDPTDAERVGRRVRAKVYRELPGKMKEGTALVLYAPHLEDFQVMFYNNKVAAYTGLIAYNIMDSLQRRNVPVGVFDARVDSAGRTFLSNYSNVYYIAANLP